MIRLHEGNGILAPQMSLGKTAHVCNYPKMAGVGGKGCDCFTYYTNFDISKFNLKQKTSALGNNYRVCGVYSPEPRTCIEVYCVWLNFNLSNLVYSSFLAKVRFPR